MIDPDNIDILANDIHAWANGVFPDRKPNDVLVKLSEELGELIRSPYSEHEFADVMVLLLDFAKMHGIMVGRGVREKMIINRQRTWKIDPSTRIMRHIDE